MDKKLKISTLRSQSTDLDFWLTKTVSERLNALELLRKQYIDYTNAIKRLQRVCRITHRKVSSCYRDLDDIENLTKNKD